MKARFEEIVRHFRKNGLTLMLQRPGNVRDLLALTRTPLLGGIDFARMSVDPTSYVAADYRHLASDLVLKVPFRTRGGGRRRTLTLYILIEHQSEPDPLMILRVLEYLVQIYKGQLRAWQRRHGSLTGFRLQPVLPVVVYTGAGRWDDLGRLVGLVDGGELFAEVVPDFRPLFLSLPALSPEQLEGEGGYFGWVLGLVQRRAAPLEEFRALVSRAVDHLEVMLPAERERWLDLLSYLVALIYHDRAGPEREELRQRVEASVQRDPRRLEVIEMIWSGADALREEGRIEGTVRTLRQMLLRQLRIKFKKVPRAVQSVINATDDIERLQGWCDRVMTAATLQDMDIVAQDQP
jgi:hypothetical protein